MATLVRAVAGVSGIPAGFPILVDDAMRVIEPAFAYLIELATIPGRSHSPQTVRTYAEHLHDWFDTLEQSGLEWRTVEERTIARYRNRMLEGPSQHTGRPYERATINARVHTICRFYGWAHRRGLVARLPFSLVEAWSGVLPDRREHAVLTPHGDGARAWANVLTVAQHASIPRPLRASELARLLAVLEQPYRLMAEWAVTTGARRMELCALTVRQVPSSVGLDPERDPFVGVVITATKGGRPRTLYPPLGLVDRTHWYIGEERAAAVRAAGHAVHGTRLSSLFLRPIGGVPTPASASAVFGRAFRTAGLAGSLHTLRHTFAVTMLAALQHRARIDPDLNPLKVLQVLLGHASIETTALYLRCVELHEESLADSVDHLYGALIRDVAA